MGDFLRLCLALAMPVVQIMLGVAIGYWLRDRRPAPSQDGERTREVLSKLQLLATSVADEVGEHSQCMEAIGEKLAATHSTDRPDKAEQVIVEAVAEIVTANKRLQDKLKSAELRLQEQAQRISFHVAEARIDALTDLANRRALDDELLRRFAECERSKATFSLLAIDIDYFKKFNDQYGHQAGDRVLRNVGQTIRATMREMDLVARYGGEEFVVVLPQTNLAGARLAAERVREAVERSKWWLGQEALEVTVSIGTSEVLAGDQPGPLFERADAALFEAKRAGRNRSYFHDGTQAFPVLEGDAEVAELAATARQTQPNEATSAGEEHTHAPADPRIDALTGLPNRHALSDDLRHLVADCLTQWKPLSMMLVGLGRLQSVNAVHGQLVVDQVLCEVTKLLTTALGSAGTLSRFSWEEFAVILPCGEEQAAQVRDRIVNALASCPLLHVSKVETGVGLTELRREDDSVTLAKRAESLLRAAHGSANKNRTQVLPLDTSPGLSTLATPSTI
jgi:diguanylate cyclase (GGDEF)-like protein